MDFVQSDSYLRLISCDAGQARLAQDLAKKIGVNVKAATTKVGIYMNQVAPPVALQGGTWGIFKPGN